MRPIWVEQKVPSPVDCPKQIGEFEIGLHLQKLAIFSLNKPVSDPLEG